MLSVKTGSPCGYEWKCDPYFICIVKNLGTMLKTSYHEGKEDWDQVVQS